MRVWIERLALAAALAAGVSYLATWNMALTPFAAFAWKGAGVALLAIYAAVKARGTDAALLVAVLMFGALGDVLLETSGLIVGAVAFLVGHLLAIALYLRNRKRFGAAQLLAAAVFVIVAVGLAMALTPDGPLRGGVALYMSGLATMAATAWLSRFPRIVALGALMFVASDLLIFARAGVLQGQAWASFAVWILYFGGQVLIAVGVSRTLTARRR